MAAKTRKKRKMEGQIAEWKWFCSGVVARFLQLAYNLKRVLNLVSFAQLMRAVGASAPQTA